MEKVMLLIVFVAGCTVCGSLVAGDRSGSGIGGRGGVAPFGMDSFTPQRRPEPRKEPSAAAGGSAEKREADKEEKKPSLVKKITVTK